MPKWFRSQAGAATCQRNADAPLSKPLSLITFQGGSDSLNVALEHHELRLGHGGRLDGRHHDHDDHAEQPTYIHTKNCKGGTEHMVYDISGMGHTWPAEGSKLSWQFFANHPLS
jgi:poly(3-hydroxybutyrate) depolymerase